MKKKLFLFLVTVFAICWQMNAGPVDCYGKLQVNGKDIVGSKTGTTPVQVKGVSLGWSNTNWESAAYYNTNSVNAMADLWNVEVIRAACGGKDYNGSYFDSQGGYAQQPTANKDRIKTVVEAAINKGIYVIIDWHSHQAEAEKELAKGFLSEMAQLYGNYDNVIFEIYNEPVTTTWSNVRTYANEIVAEIRKYSDNLILVGTRNYSQCLNEIGSNKVIDSKNNTGYVLHFYAATHQLGTWTPCAGSFQKEIENAQSNNLAVFITEWGTVAADGAGAHNATESDKWLTFLDQKKISSCAWQLSHKNEASAYFKSNISTSAASAFTNQSNLTATGQYIYNMLQTWATKAPWRNCTTTPTNTVIADCETRETALCTTWWTYDDGTSTITATKDADGAILMTQGGAAVGNGYVSVTYNVTGPWGVGFGFNLDEKTVGANKVSVNLTGATGITFRHRGTAGTIQVSTAQYAENFSANVSAHASWTQVTVPFSSMYVTYGSNIGMQLTNISAVNAIQFQIGSGSGTFSIDHIQLDNINLKLCDTQQPCTPPAISLTSSTGSANQTVCEAAAITNITYSLSGGATGATVSGLPSGIIYNVAGGILTISGTPVGSGIFNYTVTTSGHTAPCTAATATGSITVVAKHIVNFDSDGGSEVPAKTVCPGIAITKPTPDPTKQGYDFTGWYLGATAFDFNTPITGNITLTAQWELSTGITEVSVAAIEIYPNPAKSGNFNVSLSNSETAILTITNLQGQAVYNTVVKNGFAAISTNLEAGVYIVSVRSEGGLRRQKLVVK